METITSIEVPSGALYGKDDILLLRQMAAAGFVRYSDKPFRLKSGIESNVYVFGREDVTDDPAFGAALGKRILDECIELLGPPPQHTCIIGIPTAGTALAASASLMTAAWDAESRIAYRVMREAKKTHGAHQTWVNGKPDYDRQRYVLLDNVTTDGASKIEAAEKLADDGYRIGEMDALILVDRQQGALKRLVTVGFKSVRVIYNLLDLTYAFGKLALWPESAVAAVEQEIAAHQLL